MELGFQIPNISGIPDSLSCILDSKAQDSAFFQNLRFPESAFKKQKFPRLRRDRKLAITILTEVK